MTTPPSRAAECTASPDHARPRRLRVIDAPNTETAPSPATEGAISGAPQSDTTTGPDQAPGSRPVTEVRYGDLLAVCGLCGGAGASTLAYLIGLCAARQQPEEAVLVCDTGGPSAGVAFYANVAAPRSLVELAELMAAGRPTGCPYVETTEGLRVLATSPRFTPACRREGIERVLEQARAAHALTVVDCGTLTRKAEQLVLAQASHIAWVLPATQSGVRRAHQVLEAINPSMLGRELVIARRDAREPKAPLADLKALAARRSDTLILVPQLPDLTETKPTAALELAQVPLQAILGALQR